MKRGSILCAVLATACGDDGLVPADGSTGDPSSSDPGTDPSTPGTSDATSTTDPGDETAEPPPLSCTTKMCGDPAACCATDDDCVLGQCVPACGSAIRCGADLTDCCDEGQVCVGSDCVTPGDPCIDATDCPDGHQCEPALDACVPLPAGPVCEIHPAFDTLDVVLKWSHTGDDSISIPVVGDVDGDGMPEVVINTYASSGIADFHAEIVILDGVTGQQQARVVHDPFGSSFGSYARASIGLADVDGNGQPDIVYAGRPAIMIEPWPANSSLVHAVDGTGALLWSTHGPAGDPHYIYVRQAAPAFANFDDDDASEIVYGAVVIDHDGLVVADVAHASGFGGGVYGSNGVEFQSGRGGISAVADLTGDGYPEIVSGADAWSVTWDASVPGAPAVTLTSLWQNTDGPDGYPAVADLDGDGSPEVVIVAAGTLRVVDGGTGQLMCAVDPNGASCDLDPSARTQPIALVSAPPGPACNFVQPCPSGSECVDGQCTNLNRGGSPVVADFDGDGRPEIGVAGGNFFAVYDLYREGEDVVQAPGFPTAMPGELFVRWTLPIDDAGSQQTGASAFDFQGDGAAEVLYADECHLRVLDGRDGSVMLQIENQSDTIREYPLVADVDADGEPEIVVVANDVGGASVCAQYPGYVPRQGVYVYGDPNGQWVRSRRAWNQHGYHGTNATSIGLVPPSEWPHWIDPDRNTYRQTIEPAGMFNAPDLAVSLTADLGTCESGILKIIVTVHNVGSTVAPAGLPVSLYEGTDATGELVSTKPTTGPILPGHALDRTWTIMTTPQTELSFFALVDNDVADRPTGSVFECSESNNAIATTFVSCPPAE